MPRAAVNIAKRIGMFGAGAIVFALYYISDVWGERFETTSYGVLCVVFVFVLAMALALSSRQERCHTAPNSISVGWPSQALVTIRPVIFLSVLSLYVVLQNILGYTVATVLAFAGLLYLMKVRNPQLVIAISGGLTAMTYLLFVKVMGVPLPSGPFSF